MTNASAATASAPPPSPITPSRALGPLHAALLTVGAMIGSGIYSAPADTAQRAPSLSAMLAVWTLGGALTLLGALSTAELGASLPATGGLYVWLRRAFGPAVAFLFGWAMLVVLVPSSVAFYAGVTAQHLAPVLRLPRAAVSVGLVALVALLNVFGVLPTARVQSATTALRVGGLLLLAFVAFAVGAPPPVTPPPAPHAPVTVGAMLAAVVPVLWAYDGWIDITSLGREMRDPAKDTPRALVLGVLVVTAIYLAVVAAFALALGVDVLATAQAPGNALGARIAGEPGRHAVAALVATSTLGGCVVALLTGTRVVAALGEHEPALRALSVLGPRGAPDRSIAITAGLAVAYVLSPWMGRLAEVFVVGAWPFYALGAVATMVIRRREPELARPFRTPWYPWPCVGFLAVTLVMLVAFARSEPRSTALSLGMVALGLPVYAFLRGLERGTKAARDG